MTSSRWRDDVAKRNARQAAHDDRQGQALWVLRKGQHEARAEICVLPHGEELRYLWNGQLMESCLYRDGDVTALMTYADEKRRDLLERGWQK
jgi:hypothetical protein